MIQIAIYDRLRGLVDGRVFPTIAPPDAPTPRITYVLPSDIHSITFLGRNGHRDVAVQVDCWAKDSYTAEQLALSAIEAMETLPVMAGSAAWDAGSEQEQIPEEPFSVTEISRVGDDYEASTGLYRVTYEYDLTI